MSSTISNWRLAIEHEYTRDLVVIHHDEHGGEVGWSCIPQVPDHRVWQIFDTRRDDKTGWRRLALERVS
jgi:hypothetical protein